MANCLVNGRFKKGSIPWNKGNKGLKSWHKLEGLSLGHGWNKGKYGYSNNKKSNGYINTHGYLVFCIKGKEILAHRMIWEKYHGKIIKGFIVHHNDGNKLNNDISNLKLITRVDHAKIHDCATIMRRAK